MFEKDKQHVIRISRASGHRSNILPSHSAALGSNLDAPEMAAGVVKESGLHLIENKIIGISFMVKKGYKGLSLPVNQGLSSEDH